MMRVGSDFVDRDATRERERKNIFVSVLDAIAFHVSAHCK